MMFIPHAARNRFACLLMLLPPLLLPVVAGCGGGSGGSSDDRGRVEKIVFVSGDDGFGGINIISPDGTGRRLVFSADGDTGPPAFVPSYNSPTFSPDGTKIAFRSNREDCGGVGCSGGGNPFEGFSPIGPSQIWLINTDGTGLRQLTRSEAGGGADTLQFSPDGSRVLYMAYESGPYNRVNVLRGVQIDGGGDTVLVRGKEHNIVHGTEFSEASLSPDGSKVLFASDRDGDNATNHSHIYVMNLDGSGETRLTNSPLWDSSPSFSPDGSRILFRRSGYPEGKPFYELYVINADGTGETRLTNNMGFVWTSSFSPDGAKILFIGNNGRGERLFVINADGTDQHPVSAGDGFGGLKFFSGNISHHGAWVLTPAQ
ncbi:MAG: PD40 domain-containing protein [Fibrella sp.]|nr:PD40 domain-containing protein [Armatimonadota bacterium]